jgi:hypothetical protein
MLAVGDGLTALCNTYEVDGRVSWHPPDARGFASANCYLLRDGPVALLVDTGLTIHGPALEQQIAALLDEDVELRILTLRQGEFDSMCNLLPLVERFGVKTLYGQFDDILRWADFRVDFDVARGWAPAGGPVASVRLSRRETLAVGRVGSRRLDVFRPLLRLLSTHWVYDETSRTLLTSDAFSYVVRPTEDGPWQVTEADDDVTVDDISEHLVNTRYWWLRESDIDDVRRDLSATFERYDIDHIAPAFGALLSGPNVVARHFELMDQSIVQLGRSSAGAVS